MQYHHPLCTTDTLRVYYASYYLSCAMLDVFTRMSNLLVACWLDISDSQAPPPQQPTVAYRVTD